jgi:hypothetical protein
MDDMQLLYSCPIRSVAASYMHDDQSEAVMMRWGLIRSWAEGQSASLPTGKEARKRTHDRIASDEILPINFVASGTDRNRCAR